MSIYFYLALFLSEAILICHSQEDYQRRAADLHNGHRSRHQTPPLQMDHDLNNRAVQCAQYLADKKRLEHDCPYRNGAGDNLYASMGGQPSPREVAEGATQSWYQEESKYDYNNPGFSMETGHFTAMIWKSSTKFGFGFARNGDFSVGVGLYYPHPNVGGQYEENVLRPGGGGGEPKILLCEHANFEGRCIDVNVQGGGCVNLPELNFNDVASSINMRDMCVFLWEHSGCSGRNIKVAPGTPSHTNLGGVDFNDMASSLQKC